VLEDAFEHLIDVEESFNILPRAISEGGIWLRHGGG
jgi:hypothetical protein